MEVMECIAWCVAAVWCLLGPLMHNECDKDYLGLNEKE